MDYLIVYLDFYGPIGRKMIILLKILFLPINLVILRPIWSNKIAKDRKFDKLFIFIS